MNNYGQPPYGAPPGVPGNGQQPAWAPNPAMQQPPAPASAYGQPPQQHYGQPPAGPPQGQQGGYMRSYFAGIEQAQPGFGSNYLHPGHTYVLLVTGNKARASQKKMGGVLNFIGEFRVLESTDPSRPVASNASYVCPSDKPSTLGNWKAFMAACCGLNPGDEATVNREITQQLCEFAVSAEQPLAGRTKDGRFVVVRCSTESVTTQRGGQYTKHSFMPVLPGTEEYNRLAPMAERILSGAVQAPASPGGPPPGQQVQQPAAAPAPYGAPQGVPMGGGQPSPYGQPPATAPALPPAAAAPPAQQWVEHPHDGRYEYIPGTQQVRLKGA